MAHAAAAAVFPHQEGHERTRRSLGVAVKKVQLVGVLIAARPLDKAQAKKADIEVDVCLDLPGNQGDVMDAARHS